MEKALILSNTKTLFLVSTGLLLVSFGWLEAAETASLNFSPASGTYQVGQVFPVEIRISSTDQSMNAAGGVIAFPQDKLEVVSLLKNNSIINLWVQEPSFSNAQGTINFEGIVLNPGYKGAGGSIITVNFKGKAMGSAPLGFSSASILANDGLGTNILASAGTAQFNLAASGITPPAAISGVPAAPQVTSPTHPDPNTWYANPDPKFTWQIPSGITGARLLSDKNPDSTPQVVYSPAIAEKELQDLADGIWYFHVQLRNAKGWGEISHFRFQIDTQPPDPFSIKFVHGKTVIDPSPIISFNTTDQLSGIRYYKIKIGSGSFFEIDPNLILSNPYSLPTQDPGKNTVVVQAYDKAGNTATAVEEFEILALESPKITRYQENIVEGDLLEIGGKTYPDSDVDLFLLQEERKVLEQRVRSNSSGDFTFIWARKLESGVYEVQAEVTDNRGARSLPSEKITVVVAKSAIFRVGSWAIGLLAVIVPLTLLIFGLLFIIWHGWHKFSLLRKRLRKEVREAESSLHTAFDLLKEDIQKQIELLEKTKSKRALTQEEKKIVAQLKKDLDAAERLIRKEIEDIERVN